MNFNRLVPKLLLVGLTVGMWWTASAVAWAAEAGVSDKGSASPWVFPYFLVVLGVGLGLAVACNPSRRREKAKPDDYTQKKLV